VLQMDYSASTVPQASFTSDEYGLYVPDPEVGRNGVLWSYGPLDVYVDVGCRNMVL
jgi:hypothetical protein